VQWRFFVNNTHFGDLPRRLPGEGQANAFPDCPLGMTSASMLGVGLQSGSCTGSCRRKDLGGILLGDGNENLNDFAVELRSAAVQ
jgi:hypothetical protein